MVETKTNPLKQEVKHRMGRRLNDWDYAGRGIYMVTITIEERRPLLGQLVNIGGEWSVEASVVGRIVQGCLAEVPMQWPGVSLIAAQLMPDHLHFIIFIEQAQQKPLGAIVGSLKAKSTSRYLAAQDLGASGQAQNAVGYCASPLAAKFWAQGYVDLVLLCHEQTLKVPY